MNFLGNINNTTRNLVLLSIVFISVLMHFNNFSKELVSIHVWRQTQTQSTVINFYEEDMNILNPRRNDRGNTEGIFRMEFPLMQWLTAIQYQIFGNHLIISRIFMFLVGIASILGLYSLLMALFNKPLLALIGAWAFNFSPSFYYYTINPLPDNLALCCSIWGLALFFKWTNSKNHKSLLLSGLLLSLGALCKLPFIIYFIVPSIYFLQQILKNGFSKLIVAQILSAFSFVIFPLIWYAAVIPTWHGNVIVKGMLENKDSYFQLLDYLQHNLISTMPELLLNYGSLLFFITGFYFLFKRKAYKNSKFLPLFGLSISVLVYFLFEINAIAKIHDYYLFPFYPLLFILVAYGAYYFFNTSRFNKYFTLFLLAILPFTCYLRMHERWDVESPGFNKDLLTYKLELRNAVPKNALVVAGNDESHFIFFYYIDKKGWGFDSNTLTPEMLNNHISKGAEYIYIDSGLIEENEEFDPLIDDLVLKKGSISIYSLRKQKS